MQFTQPGLFGHHYRWTMAALWFLMLIPVRAVAAEGSSGEQIYRQRCASCHGSKGEGTEDKYPNPLVGEKSVVQLANFIARKMPKDSPNKCTGPEAGKLAAYLYETFYSKEAHDRNKPPRIELSRLTVRQYRNAVADLVDSFRSPGRWDNQHGLHGEYFKGRQFRDNERVLDRVDPAVQFDFGESGPTDKFDANQFSI